MRNRLLFPLEDDGATIETPRSKKKRTARGGAKRARVPQQPVSKDEASAADETLSVAAEAPSVDSSSLPEPVTNLLIRASAGTGKTYQLTSRYLKLLLLGGSPETILATTFTRKAAGEILDRIVHWLSAAAMEETQLAALAQAVNMPKLTRDDCQDKLSLLTRQMHRLRIYTIDAFFMQVALSFSLELGLTPGWDIIEEGPESNTLRDEAIAGILRDEVFEDLLVLLHQLAPKGEAKRGLDSMLKDRVREAYRLFLDSTATAWDMIEVPAPLPDEEVDAVRHELAHFPLSGKKIPQAVEADIDRLCQNDWRGFLSGGKTLVRSISEGKSKYWNANIPDELAAIYRRFLPHLRAMILQSASAQTKGTHRFLTKYHAHFGQLKASQRLHSFDEITSLLADQPQADNLDRFSFRMDAGIDHLLLDEFQDTSVAQWKALFPLARRCTEDVEERSFFCVGDVKQAIYGWRGGSSEIFDVLDRKLPNLSNSQLQESRRSSPVVIDAVNQVFEGLPEWDERRLGRAKRAAKHWEFSTHTTYRKNLPGYFTIETSEESSSNSKEDQEKSVFQRAAERVSAIAKQAPGRSVGILCRTNAKVGRMMNELQRLGVPASEEGGNLLTDSAAVELVLSLLHLADHPSDSITAYHLARSPWAPQLGLSPWTSDTSAAGTSADSGAPGAETEELVRRPPGGIDPRSIRGLSRRVRRQLHEHGFGDTVQRWARELWNFCHRREARRLTQLVELAYGYQHKIESPAQLGYEYQRRRSIRPTEFVRYVRETKVADPSNDTIRVMTVHQAKGLEFDIVVLPDLLGPFVEGHDMFLHRRPSIDDEIDLVCRYMGKDSGRSFLPEQFMPLFDRWEDQRAKDSFCVLYVAMTRAIHALHIFLPSGLQRMAGGKGNAAYLVKDTFVAGVPLEPASTVHAAGDPHWFTEGQPEIPLDPDFTARVPEVRLAKSRRSRHVDVVAPSQVGANRYVRLRDRLRVQSDEARHFGTLVHLWLSQCEWFTTDADCFGVASLRALAAPFADRLDVDAAVQRFRSMLTTEPLLQVLDRKLYESDLRTAQQDLPARPDLEVRREQRVAGRDEATVLSGTIDRLVLIKQAGQLVAADIIDFKTHDGAEMGSEASAQKMERYEAQMSAYRRVIATSLRLPSSRVSSRLVML